MCWLLVQVFQLFVQFKTTTKSHVSYAFLYPFSSVAISPQNNDFLKFYTSKLYGLTGMGYISLRHIPVICSKISQRLMSWFFFFFFLKQINYGGELGLKIHPFLTWIFAAECNNGEREDSLWMLILFTYPITIQYSFIAECQGYCTRHISWCQVLSLIDANYKMKRYVKVLSIWVTHFAYIFT